MKKKTIEFFMMLTNRSIYLAHYTIRSYVKVYVKMKSEYDIQLTIYLNAINYSKYQSEIDEFEKYPFVKLIKSASRKDDFVFNGKHYCQNLMDFSTHCLLRECRKVRILHMQILNLIIL